MHYFIRVVRRCVFYHRDSVAEFSSKANGRLDAGMCYESDDDDLLNAVFFELQIQMKRPSFPNKCESIAALPTGLWFSRFGCGFLAIAVATVLSGLSVEQLFAAESATSGTSRNALGAAIRAARPLLAATRIRLGWGMERLGARATSSYRRSGSERDNDARRGRPYTAARSICGRLCGHLVRRDVQLLRKPSKRVPGQP
jgi:hypothetical protein